MQSEGGGDAPGDSWGGRIAIYEAGGGGHRLSYVRYLVEGLAERGIRPIVVLGDIALDDPAYETQLAPHRDRFDQVVVPARTGRPVIAFARRARQISSILKKHRPDRLWVPDGTGLAQIAWMLSRIGLFRTHGVKVRVLIVRVAALYRRGGSLIRRLGDRMFEAMVASGIFDHVVLIDRYAQRWLRERGHTGRSVFTWDPLPEAPEATPAECRERLGLDPGGRGWSMAGRIDQRKGADLAIRAFMRLHESGRIRDDDRLFLAGGADAAVRELLEGEAAPLVESGRIVRGPAYVSEDDFWYWLGAGDVVLACYPRHIGPASLPVRAAALRRPVVGESDSWIARTIEDFGLGVVTDSASRELDEAMLAMLDGAAEWRRNRAAADMIAGSTIPAFTRVWLGEHDEG